MRFTKQGWDLLVNARGAAETGRGSEFRGVAAKTGWDPLRVLPRKTNQGEDIVADARRFRRKCVPRLGSMPVDIDLQRRSHVSRV